MSGSPIEPPTLLQALSNWSKTQPNQQAWTFLSDKAEPIDSYTYKELDDVSSFMANAIQESPHVISGDRVLLVFFPGLDFMVSLLACFKASVIAVPVFPPDPRKLKKDLHHFVSIQMSSGAKAVLTNSQYNFVKKIEDVKRVFSLDSTNNKKWPEMKWIQVDDYIKSGKKFSTTTSSSSLYSSSGSSKEEVAFLQYTSGSTSEPKGVIISHQNLAHNLTLIIDELRANCSTVNVSWLPQYHDMGLIGSYLGVLYCGGTGFYLSPISFLKDPTVWLRAISKYGGTHTQAPSFAYALVTRKFKDLQSKIKKTKESTMDLSTLQHMINAAEPVDPRAISDFYRTFAPYQLPPGVVVPTYGLAEHTVFVCSGGKQALCIRKAAFESGAIEIVSEQMLDAMETVDQLATDAVVDDQTMVICGCGYPGHSSDVELVIVEPEVAAQDGEERVTHTRWRSKPLTVGEIWVTSPSKAQGYWGQPDLSTADFYATVGDDDDAGDGTAMIAKVDSSVTGASRTAATSTFLRTGDLGFMHNGELFITGRSKDLIIIGGSNHYPQDIERSVEQGPGQLSQSIRAGCSAAFSSVHRSIEGVVYIAELKDGVSKLLHQQIVFECREVISSDHGLSVRAVCLLQSRTIPKTTSGKIARSWCRRAYEEGRLQILHEWTGATSGKTDQLHLVDSGSGGRDYQPVNRNSDGGAVADLATVKDDTAAVSGIGREGAKGEDRDATFEDIIPIWESSEEVRILTQPEIARHLEAMLLQIVASQGACSVQMNEESGTTGEMVDRGLPLVSLGLDSMTIVQFKGGLENRFFCDVPDDFLFSDYASLGKLAETVQRGCLTDKELKAFEEIKAGNNGSGQSTVPVEGDGGNTVVEVGGKIKQPWCPWFTCCY